MSLKKKIKSKYKLANTSWPCFRATSGSSGCSSFSGPKENTIVWELKVGKPSGEPSIGIDGTIYLPLKSNKLIAIDIEGKKLWQKSLYSYMKKPLRGITTPAIRGDGSLIVAAFRKVVCLEVDGSIRWEKLIDGLPTPVKIGPQGSIYISALSVDWAGIYIISPKGDSIGKDDPILYSWKDWTWMLRRSEVSPVAIDPDGNVFVAYRANTTHPEAYTWDPPDEVDEDFYYECAIFDTEGNKIGQFLHDFYSPSYGIPNSITINKEKNIHYIAGPMGDLYVFKLDDLLSIDIPEGIDWNSWGERSDVVKEMVKSCDWTWDRNRDDEVYIGETTGFPALGDDSKAWLRLVQKYKKHKTKKMSISSQSRILNLDPSELVSKDILHYYTLDFPSKVIADPIIDCNNLIYVGDLDGNVRIFNSAREVIKIIETRHPISYLIIGPENSLVVVSKNGYISLIR